MAAHGVLIASVLIGNVAIGSVMGGHLGTLELTAFAMAVMGFTYGVAMCRMVTVATMAAVAFAGLLVIIMRSDEVRGILTDLVRRALTVA